VLSEDGAGLLPYRSPLRLYATIAIASFVGPFLSAFIMTGITEEREGVGRLLRQVVLWRVGLRWYLFALMGLPAIMVLSVIFLPGALASFQGLAGVAPLPMLALFVYVFFLGGPLGEEPGWRGFALPGLQRLYGLWSAIGGVAAFDWRVVVNDRADQMLYESGALHTRMPFAQLRAACFIDPKARAADHDPAFSERIREGVPRPVGR
jgi:hypothetical protein